MKYPGDQTLRVGEGKGIDLQMLMVVAHRKKRPCENNMQMRNKGSFCPTPTSYGQKKPRAPLGSPHPLPLKVRH